MGVEMHPRQAPTNGARSDRTLPSKRDREVDEPHDGDLNELEAIAYRVCDARPRQRCELVGTVVTAGAAPGRLLALDLVLDDRTGQVRCHFTGRHALPGVVGGTRIRVEGTLRVHGTTPCLLNPTYEVLGAADGSSASS